MRPHRRPASVAALAPDGTLGGVNSLATFGDGRGVARRAGKPGWGFDAELGTDFSTPFTEIPLPTCAPNLHVVSTSGFQISSFCNQAVGFAIGKCSDHCS